MTSTRRTVAAICMAVLVAALVWGLLSPMASLALAKMTGTDATPDSSSVYVLPDTDIDW